MGSNDMPELGSRISLISKADIRYEGKLFTVDPQDCTIALANVRSFGTEDRETAHPVPAQNQVYDYILFRATDIKDISVIPSQQLLYDPAIVQLSAPPSIGSSRGFQSQQSQGGGGSGGGFTHPVLGSMGGGGGFNPMQSGLQAMGQAQRGGPLPPSELHNHQGPNNECVLDLLSGSRSSTPGVRKVSPTVDQGIQAQRKLQSPPKDKYRSQQQHGNRQGGQQGGVQQGGNLQQRNHQQQPQQQQQQQQQRNHRENYNQWYTQGYQQQQQQQNRWRGGSGGGGGGGGNRMPMRGNRGRGGNFPRAPGGGAPTKKQPLKFDADYDFDKANTEFEELRTQLAKVKIGEGVAEVAAAGAVLALAPGAPPQPPAAVAPQQQNGEEKKDDSGNETGIGEGEVDESAEFFYNKKKSFYDNISCEAIERSKGRSQRTDWRKERKLNSETFGVSMTRRQGLYRGRGGYYQNQGNRGGYFSGRSGGYRSNNAGYRQQNKNRQPQMPIQPPSIEVAKA